MTVVVALLLVVVVSAAVALPLAYSGAGPEAPSDLGVERLQREKNAALTAIREAQFDHAMGKLSEEDYASLRSFYERRALTALTELNALPAGQSVDACSRCGRQFIDDSVFCGGCGQPRSSSAS